MARRVDKVELVDLTILSGVIQRYTLSLDGDTTFALKLHRVEHLLLHFPITQTTTMLDEPVSQRRFSVVNMGDDRKISNMS
ncbi:hypothetical protein GCM10023116_06390 [Kistimonas scapharcae]|uniref:Uncharacterized protein n=1 Tax=Kistimonas scapharcae TaxID=1036133 RepID=A0ABP8UXN2_9GAMM